MDPSLRAFLTSMAPFDESELDEASLLYNYQVIKKNSFFLKAGHYSDRLAYIKSGMLRFYFEANGKETTTFFATPGTIAVDLHGFLKIAPSNESVHALVDTEIMYIKRNTLYSLYPGNWKWQQVGRVLLEQYYVANEERTIRLQCKSAPELYKIFLQQHPDIVKIASLSYIASYLGMSPETLSRIRSQK